MTGRLRTATPTRTNSVVMRDDSPTEKIIFGGESIAK